MTKSIDENYNSIGYTIRSCLFSKPRYKHSIYLKSIKKINLNMAYMYKGLKY